MDSIRKNPFKVRTVKNCQTEDWKTALAHNIKPIPAGIELTAEVYYNFYGSWLIVRYNDWTYYIDPKSCDFIDL